MLQNSSREFFNTAMPIQVQSFQIDKSNMLHFYSSKSPDAKTELDSIGATGMHSSGIKVYTKETLFDKISYAWNKLLGNTVDLAIQTNASSQPVSCTVDKKELEAFLARNSGKNDRSPGLEKILQNVLNSIKERPVAAYGSSEPSKLEARRPAPLAIPENFENNLRIMTPTPKVQILVTPEKEIPIAPKDEALAKLAQDLASGPKQAQPKTKVATRLTDLNARMQHANIQTKALTKAQATHLLNQLLAGYPQGSQQGKKIGNVTENTLTTLLSMLNEAGKQRSKSFEFGISQAECAQAWRLLDNLRIQASK